LEARDEIEKKEKPAYEYKGPPIDVDVLLNEYKNRLRSPSKVPEISKKEIEEEGDVRPKAHIYRSTDLSYKKQVDERVRKGRELYFRENYPGATEEQLQQYLKSFES
jgi:hypothetical protein